MDKKSIKRYSIPTKYYLIIECLKPDAVRKNIHKKYGVRKGLILTCLKEKELIIIAFKSELVASHKNLRRVKYPDLDKKLNQFIELNAKKMASVSNLILEKKTKLLIEEMKIAISEKWRANGYLQKFKKRNLIYLAKSFGEADFVLEKTIE